MLIEEYLIEQCKNPYGFIGKLMTKIWNNTFEAISSWAIDKINIEENNYVLDIGCGGGKTVQTLETIAREGEVYGIDISEYAIQTSIDLNKKKVESGKIKFIQADVVKLPFKNNKFNVITAFQTHFYWKDLKAGLEEINRVLMPNGTLLIVCEKDKIEYHMNQYKDKNEMKELLNEIGFDKVEIIENSKWIGFISKGGAENNVVEEI